MSSDLGSEPPECFVLSLLPQGVGRGVLDLPLGASRKDQGNLKKEATIQLALPSFLGISSLSNLPLHWWITARVDQGTLQRGVGRAAHSWVGRSLESA